MIFRFAVLTLFLSFVLHAGDEPQVDQTVQSLACQALLHKADTQLQGGSLVVAVRFYLDLLANPEADSGVVVGDRIRSARRVVRDRLRKLAPEQLDVYQGVADGYATTLLDQYHRTRDIALVRNVVERYPFSTAYAESLLILVRYEMDNGRFAAANELFQLYRRDVGEIPESHRNAAALAALRGGDYERAKALIATLPDSPEKTRYLTLLQQKKPVGGKTYTLAQPLTVLWKQDCGTHLGLGARSQECHGVVDPVFGFKKHGRMCVDGFAASDDVLMHRIDTRTNRIDPGTGEVLSTWVQDESAEMLGRLRGGGPRNLVPTPSGKVYCEDWTGTAMSLSDGHVYMVEQSLDLNHHRNHSQGSAIAKRHVATGQLLWSVGRDADALRSNERAFAMIAPVTVDAYRDDWLHQSAIHLSGVSFSSQPRLEGEGWVAASTHGMHFFLQAEDKTPNPPENTSLTKADFVSIYISREGHHRGTLVLEVGWAGTKVLKNARSFGNWRIPKIEFQAAARQDSERYYVEITLPWAELGGPLYGKTLRIAPRIHDRSGKESRYSALGTTDDGHDRVLVKYLNPALSRIPWPVTDARFLSAPLGVGAQQICMYKREQSISLVALANADGRLNWHANIGSSTAKSQIIARGALAHADDIFALPGSGMVARISPGLGEVEWSVGYARASQIAEAEWKTEMYKRPHDKPLQIQTPSGWLTNTLLVDRNRVIAFPSDAGLILALDRDTGNAIYSIPRESFTYVLGHRTGHAFVAGVDELGCLDLATGKWKWRAPLQNSQGKGLINGDEILVPNGQSVLRFDSETGKRTGEFAVHNYFEHPLLNLHLERGGLFVVGGGKVARLVSDGELADADLQGLALACRQRANGKGKEALETLLRTEDVDPARLAEFLNPSDMYVSAAKAILADPRLSAELELQLNAVDTLLNADDESALDAIFGLLVSPGNRIHTVPAEPRKFPLYHSAVQAAQERLRAFAEQDPDAVAAAWERAFGQCERTRASLGSLLLVAPNETARTKAINAITPVMQQLPSAMRSLKTAAPKAAVPKTGGRVVGFECLGHIPRQRQTLEREGLYFLDLRGKLEKFDSVSSTPAWSTRIGGAQRGFRVKKDGSFIAAPTEDGFVLIDDQSGVIAVAISMDTLGGRGFSWRKWYSVAALDCRGPLITLVLRSPMRDLLIGLDAVSGRLLYFRELFAPRMHFTNSADGMLAIERLCPDLTTYRFVPESGRLDHRYAPRPSAGFLHLLSPNEYLEFREDQLVHCTVSPPASHWSVEGFADPDYVHLDHIPDVFVAQVRKSGSKELLFADLKTGKGKILTFREHKERIRWMDVLNAPYVLGMQYRTVENRKYTICYLVDARKQKTVAAWEVNGFPKSMNGILLDNGRKVIYGMSRSGATLELRYYDRKTKKASMMKMPGPKLSWIAQINPAPDGGFACSSSAGTLIFKPRYADAETD